MFRLKQQHWFKPDVVMMLSAVVACSMVDVLASVLEWFCFQILIDFVSVTLIPILLFLIIRTNMLSGWLNQHISRNKKTGADIQTRRHSNAAGCLVRCGQRFGKYGNSNPTSSSEPEALWRFQRAWLQLYSEHRFSYTKQTCYLALWIVTCRACLVACLPRSGSQRTLCPSKSARQPQWSLSQY